MIKKVIILILLFICILSFAKNNKKEEQLKEIRKKYSNVEKNLKKFSVKESVYFTSEEPPNQYEVYFNEKMKL